MSICSCLWTTSCTVSSSVCTTSEGIMTIYLSRSYLALPSAASSETLQIRKPCLELMYSNQRKKNNFAWKSHVILKSCFQCSLVCSTLHSSRKKMILNIHTLIVFLHFTMQWWISLSMPSLKIQFHTYLIRSSKQFLHFVIFNDACHQTHRKSASSHPPLSAPPPHPVC